MHQPFYKDLVRQSYVMPWAYLHGTKDYFGMPALLEEFPQVHQTFNLVPSLVVQLEEYARGEARDALLELAFKPVDQLTAEDRRQVIKQFFPVPVRTMLQPFPRYFELYERRSDSSRHQAFSDQDIRDIQVWWTLAWLDHDRRPKDLVRKGKGFTEGDKTALRRLADEIIGGIIPLYRRLQEGQPVTVGGKTFGPELVLGPPRRGRKIVYTGDTMPTSALVEFARGADVLIHDATAETSLEEKANRYGHSTARQAALVAKDAGVGTLILTHVSPRYEEAAPILADATPVFANSVLAEDFYQLDVPYSE